MIRFSVLIFLLLLNQPTFAITDEEKSKLIDTIRKQTNVLERISFVEDIIHSDQSVETKVIAVEATRYDIDKKDNDTVADFLLQTGKDATLDDAIRAMAYKSTYRVKLISYQFEDARNYLEQAYELQPMRTEDEINQKAAQFFLIAEDIKDQGDLESALQHFFDYAHLYPHPLSQQLQLFVFFEHIPLLTKKILKENANSAVVAEILQQGLRSDQPGEMFCAAMMQFGQKDFSSAIITAQKASTLHDEPRWELYSQMLHASVLFMNDETDEMKVILNSLAEHPEHDNWITYFVRIMAMTCSEVFEEQYGMSYPLYEWYLNSPIFLNEDRQSSVSNGSVAHIIQGFAIDMMYFDPVKFPQKRNESIALLKRVYDEQYDQFSGKSSGLIIAEDMIKKGQLDEAETIITRIQKDVEDDNYLKPRTLLVLSQLHDARGEVFQLGAALREVASIPNREGNDDFTRLKNDAQNQFENNLLLQLIMVSVYATAIFLFIILIRYLFNKLFTIDFEK